MQRLLSRRTVVRTTPAAPPRYIATDLGTLGGAASFAYGVTEAGHVVGFSYDDDGNERAFLFDGTAMQALGPPGGGRGRWAFGGNEFGQTLKNLTGDGGASRAFLHDDDGLRDLGTLGDGWSLAFGVNAAGQVVGYSSTSRGEAHAFLYHDGVMIDLNELLPAGCPVTLIDARGINDSGQIAATGIDARTGQTHAYLLTPAAGV